MALTSVARDAKLQLVKDTLTNADSELSQAKPNAGKLKEAFDILAANKDVLDAEQLADLKVIRDRLVELAEALKPMVAPE